MSEQKVLSESEKKKEDWMNNKWRPMMGWSYMLTCIADFVAFPILWSLVQVIGGGRVETQWQPITLQGAGLYHIAMGAVLGIAAYGRTQEKLGGANNGGLPAAGTTYTPPAPVTAPAPISVSGQANNLPLNPAPSFGAPATTPTFGGKPGPVQPPHPEL
jgi:hypothetical protein